MSSMMQTSRSKTEYLSELVVSHSLSARRACEERWAMAGRSSGLTAPREGGRAPPVASWPSRTHPMTPLCATSRAVSVGILRYAQNTAETSAICFMILPLNPLHLSERYDRSGEVSTWSSAADPSTSSSSPTASSGSPWRYSTVRMAEKNRERNSYDGTHFCCRLRSASFSLIVRSRNPSCCLAQKRIWEASSLDFHSCGTTDRPTCMRKLASSSG
mmetsp:Transcript_4604/g.16522  ORF Transcript_4604/g.16522 Transcript_4604/m.16522 type:complete len:216 (+) Transcript_4604:5403-6050(+)